MKTRKIEDAYPTTAAAGIAGEQWLLARLRAQYAEVADYTQDWHWQRRGIDFGIRAANWHDMIYLDVKNNLRENGTFAVEIAKAADRPGWFVSSQAHRIYHVCPSQNRYMLYDLPAMRQWVICNLNRLDITQLADGSKLIWLNRTAIDELKG